MISKVYIHKSNITNFLLKLMLCLLIPFIFFGIYKSGYRVYHNGYGNVFTIIKPLLYVLIAIIISFIKAKIFKKKFISYDLLSNILISLVIIPESNFFLATGLMLLVNIINYFLKINSISLYMVILIIISMISKNYSYLNIFESSINHVYVLGDYLLGLGYGEIPITSFITYYLLLLIKLIFTHDLTSSFFINNNLIFAFVFIAPLSIYTPYSKKGCYIYGVLLGLITFAFSFLDLDLGVYLSILLLSLITKKTNKFYV